MEMIPADRGAHSSDRRPLVNPPMGFFLRPDDKNQKNLREAQEDTFWALLNSKEFICNH